MGLGHVEVSYTSVVAGVLSLIYVLTDIVTIGVSLKTQELYALVFVTRYLDLFVTFISA